MDRGDARSVDAMVILSNVTGRQEFVSTVYIIQMVITASSVKMVTMVTQ